MEAIYRSYDILMEFKIIYIISVYSINFLMFTTEDFNLIAFLKDIIYLSTTISSTSPHILA